MKGSGFGRIDATVISGERVRHLELNADKNVSLGRTRLLVALSCGGHAAEEFEEQRQTKRGSDVQYQCLRDNACTNRIVGHIGECYKRTEIGGGSGKVRCRCVEAPNESSSIRRLLDDTRNNEPVAVMKSTIEWIFARVAHEASVELGMVKNSNRAIEHRIRRYFEKRDDESYGAIDVWPKPSLDSSIYWSEYRTLFLETLVKNTIRHVLGALEKRNAVSNTTDADTLKLIASMIKTTRDSYDALLQERKRKSIQKHLEALDSRLDYEREGFSLEEPVRTTDMDDDAYAEVHAQLGEDPNKIRAYNATKILTFWGSHCSECTRGAKRTDKGPDLTPGHIVQAGGARSVKKRASRAEEHAKLMAKLRRASAAWDERNYETRSFIVQLEGVPFPPTEQEKRSRDNKKWVDALIGLIEAVTELCELVRKCTTMIRERDMKERNDRIQNPGSQRSRRIPSGQSKNPDCAKSEDANNLILVAMKNIIRLMDSTGASFSVVDAAESPRSVGVQMSDDQKELADTIRSVLMANVSNKLTGFTIEQQKRDLMRDLITGSVPTVDALVRIAVPALVDAVPDLGEYLELDPSVTKPLLKKKPRDVLEHLLVHLLTGKSKYTSKRGGYRQELDDAKQCTIKTSGPSESDFVCAKCACRARILENRLAFSRGHYAHDDDSDDANAKLLKDRTARDVLYKIETENFVPLPGSSGTLSTIRDYVLHEVWQWMEAVQASKAEDTCLCVDKCEDGKCTEWGRIWGEEKFLWFFDATEQSFDINLKGTEQIKAAQQARQVTTEEERGLVRGFLATWDVMFVDSTEAAPRRKGKSASRSRQSGSKSSKKKGKLSEEEKRERARARSEERNNETQKAQERRDADALKALQRACDRTLKKSKRIRESLVSDAEKSRVGMLGLYDSLKNAGVLTEDKAYAILDLLSTYVTTRGRFDTNWTLGSDNEEVEGRRSVVYAAAYFAWKKLLVSYAAGNARLMPVNVDVNARWMVASLERDANGEFERDDATKAAFELVETNPGLARAKEFRGADRRWVTENALAHVFGEEAETTPYDVAHILDRMVLVPGDYENLEQKTKDGVVEAAIRVCTDLSSDLSLIGNKIRGPNGKSAQVAMWVLAKTPTQKFTDRHKGMILLRTMACLFFYLYAKDSNGTWVEDVVRLFGTTQLYDRAKHFVDQSQNEYFSTRDGQDTRRYIHGITHRGEPRVPVTIVAENDGIVAIKAQETSIIMHAINAADMAASAQELANQLSVGREDRAAVLHEIEASVMNLSVSDVDVSYQKHSNGSTVVYATCPNLGEGVTGDEAVQILGGIYKSVIEEAEKNKEANKKRVRLSLLVNGSTIGKWGHGDVKRKLTVLALRRAFEEYRKEATDTSSLLKYELYTGPRESSREYKEDILNVVLPETMASFTSDISSEIPQEDINLDATEETDGVIEAILQGAQAEKTEQEALELAQKSKRDQAARVQAQKEEAVMANRRLIAYAEKRREESRLRAEEDKKRAEEAAQASKEQASKDFEDDYIQDLSEKGDRSYTGDDSAGDVEAGARKADPSLSKIRRQVASKLKLREELRKLRKMREAGLTKRRGLQDLDEKSMSELLPGLDTEDREPEIPETVQITMDRDIPKLDPISGELGPSDLEFFSEKSNKGDQDTTLGKDSIDPIDAILSDWQAANDFGVPSRWGKWI